MRYDGSQNISLSLTAMEDIIWPEKSFLPKAVDKLHLNPRSLHVTKETPWLGCLFRHLCSDFLSNFMCLWSLQVVAVDKIIRVWAPQGDQYLYKGWNKSDKFIVSHTISHFLLLYGVVWSSSTNAGSMFLAFPASRTIS